jgi:hypothetical protein
VCICWSQITLIFPYLQPNIAESTAVVKRMPKAYICQCKFGSVFTGSDGAQLKRELLSKQKVLLFHKHYETYFDPSNCSRYDCRISNTVGVCGCESGTSIQSCRPATFRSKICCLKFYIYNWLYIPGRLCKTRSSPRTYKDTCYTYTG